MQPVAAFSSRRGPGQPSSRRHLRLRLLGRPGHEVRHRPFLPPSPRLRARELPPASGATSARRSQYSSKPHTDSTDTDQFQENLCPVLVLPTVCLEAHTTTWCRLLPKMDWMSNGHGPSPPACNTLVPARPRLPPHPSGEEPELVSSLGPLSLGSLDTIRPRRASPHPIPSSASSVSLDPVRVGLPDLRHATERSPAGRPPPRPGHPLTTVLDKQPDRQSQSPSMERRPSLASNHPRPGTSWDELDRPLRTKSSQTRCGRTWSTGHLSQSVYTTHHVRPLLPQHRSRFHQAMVPFLRPRSRSRTPTPSRSHVSRGHARSQPGPPRRRASSAQLNLGTRRSQGPSLKQNLSFSLSSSTHVGSLVSCSPRDSRRWTTRPLKNHVQTPHHRPPQRPGPDTMFCQVEPDNAEVSLSVLQQPGQRIPRTPPAPRYT